MDKDKRIQHSISYRARTIELKAILADRQTYDSESEFAKWVDITNERIMRADEAGRQEGEPRVK